MIDEEIKEDIERLNKEEKEIIARKAITLESDIDATGIETGRLIDILKEMGK